MIFKLMCGFSDWPVLKISLLLVDLACFLHRGLLETFLLALLSFVNQVGYLWFLKQLSCAYIYGTSMNSKLYFSCVMSVYRIFNNQPEIKKSLFYLQGICFQI
ncbi:hypothetical protein SAY86_015349 [Trapa natans]|uniref:Uncharacterized protein n=1 Tax=Trapa natans TaxID=22666 RepID=A0AAN7QH70_TRANT|nr:hypothetical protein SAY86_015349 [Trapa natans]